MMASTDTVKASAHPDMVGQRPYRPRFIAALNRLGKSLGALGVGKGPLDEAELMRAARTRTGLSEFGDERFREPLGVLIDSIEREAGLHTVGRLITKTRLIGALATRLRVHDYLAKHPEALARTLPPPIVIAGLQRTGTTMLHRLLACDPGLRSLLSWEALGPVPVRGPLLGVEPRFLQAKLSERALAYMAPAFFAIHPVEADAPEEDVLLLDYAFLSTTPEATMHVPSYARWLEHTDNTPAYEYVATLLKVMSHQRGPERWILKTPHHLEYLDVLRKVFPGVRIVQTHRDPARTLASFCSMIWHGRGVFSDEVDAGAIGQHWSCKIGRMLERSLSVREATHDEGFFDVSYYDLIKDPLPIVSRLYGELGLSFTPEVEGRMRKTREDNPQHKYGQHRYELADFGLSRDGVEPLFAKYRTRFGVRHEK
jgi:hypothetical protein